MKRRALLHWGGASALGLAGCGGGGDEEPNQEPSSQFATGWTQMPAAVYNALPEVRANALPPVGFTAYDLSDPTLLANLGYPTVLPSPGDQGQQPSCTAWAVGYCSATTVFQYAGLNLPAAVSPADLFAKVRRRIPSACTSGAYISTAMDVLVQEGVTTLNLAPYSDQQCGLATPSVTRNLDGYSRVSPSDLFALRGCIASNQPVAFGIQVSDAFYRLNAFNSVMQPNGSGGGHAMTLIGFDDSRQLFKIANSWGTRWGAGGYCFISYANFARFASDVCLPWRRSERRVFPLSVSTSNASSPVVSEHLDALRYGQSGVYGVGVSFGWSEPLALSSASISVTDASNNILFTQNFVLSQIARGIRFGTEIPASVTGFVRLWATVSGVDGGNRAVTIGALTEPATR